jgi:UTP--glucose-1-phosphate uridylyltransferase
MLPLTKTIPKELLPVGDRPAIQYIVEALVQHNIHDIIMITSQSKKALEDYFDKHYELEDILTKKNKSDLLRAINRPKEMGNIMFVKQTAPLGTAHAIMQAKPWIGTSESVFVIFGDMIYHPKCLGDMLDLHRQTGHAIVHAATIERENVHKYGVLEVDDTSRITNLVEKPSRDQAPSNIISTGAYLLPTRIFEYIEQTPLDPISGEHCLPDAIKRMMKDHPVYASSSNYPHRDVGSIQGRLDANIDIGKHKILADCFPPSIE